MEERREEEEGERRGEREGRSEKRERGSVWADGQSEGVWSLFSSGIVRFLLSSQ